MEGVKMIINGINFDNTLSVRQFARSVEAEKLLNIPAGKEKQLYKIGMTVDGDDYGFGCGTIVDCYCQNGYFLYDVEYKLKPKSRKTYKTSLRQKDIVIMSK